MILPFFMRIKMINLINSPIQNIIFNNKSFLIKRDDLLHIDFTGNKARKFHYYLDNEFPNIKRVVSHGSNQSNAMYSLSVLAKLKNWEYIYYTNHIPSYIKENPSGNYKYALENGMTIMEDENFTIPKPNLSTSTLYISEGGAVEKAQYGIKKLVDEITKYISDNNIKNLKVFLPSGTGTTALFLQKYLDIEILTVPCVGDSVYLKKQFTELEKDEIYHPTIIKPKKKYHFGKLYKENYIIWQELNKQTGIEFDLLYDPIGWNTLLNSELLEKENILYIHQGGTKGNVTMLQRYQRKYDNNQKL